MSEQEELTQAGALGRDAHMVPVDLGLDAPPPTPKPTFE